MSAGVPAQPPLPPGVLAIIPSKSGIVRVEESGAFRLLTMDGVVHAAHFKESSQATLAPFDPLVSLLRKARPMGRTALVVGLGSGATASEIARLGYGVEVAEIEPAIIYVARQFFNYEGHAEAVDGVEVLGRDGDPHDLILLDAFAGTNMAPTLVHADVVALVRRRLKAGGLVAMRLLGSPREPRVLAALRTFANAFAHKRLYGTGQADEPQNLYLLLSDKPLRLFDLNIGPVFPVPWPDVAAPALESANEASRRDVILGKTTRRAMLLGYLVRAEDGSLCIDVAHWEMGARRYALRSAAVASLQTLLPAKLTFPTQGDLSTDGDLKKTLHPFLGGGGVKLSTVRFSPIAVAVEGILLPPKESARDKAALLMARQHEDGFAGPFDLQTFMREVKVIISNLQGEIDVERVHFTLDVPQWQDFRQKALRPLAVRATKALRDGDFKGGRDAIAGMLAAMDAKFGRLAPRIVTYDELLTLHDILSVYAPTKTESGTPPSGVVCDRVRHDYKKNYYGPYWSTDKGTKPREMGAMLAALHECAVAHYEKVVGKNPASDEAKMRASRLVTLLEDAGIDEYDEKKQQAFQQRAQTLMEQWEVERMDEPL